MGRQPCCDKVGLKRGPWTIQEDYKLMNFILNNGLLRCGKSCRLRWINYLRPDLRRGALTESEEHQIIQLHSRLGNKWSKIASHLPGRTDNEIKNHWNTRIKKQLNLLGLDPVTHRPIEKSEITGGKNKLNSDSNSSKLQDEHGMKVCPRKAEKLEEIQETLDETNDLLNNYQMLSESFDLDSGLNQDTNTCSSYTSSFSMGESNNPSMGETSSIHDDSSKQWVDGVDSFLSRDSFNFFLLGK